jgi:hypothetical protein
VSPQTPGGNQPQQSSQQSSGTSGSGGSTVTQQQFQTKMNTMDAAFVDANSEIAQVQQALSTYKTSTQAGQHVTWAQLESISQGLSRAQSRINTARQALPIQVAA